MPGSSLRRPRIPRRHGWVLLVYTLLTLALTWPLALHFTTHVPGDGIDDPALAWNLWWIKTRLVDQVNLDIFHVGWMFHPVEINLAFYTLTPFNGLLSVPLQTTLGLIVANNLLLWSSFVLGGYGTFLLCRQLLRENWRLEIGDWPISNLQSPIFAPMLAGLVYAFASSKLFYASLGQFNIASSQWIPFCALYVLRIGQSPTRRAGLCNAALAGLFFIFQAWAELTYASFLLLFIALYFAWLLITRRRQVSGFRSLISNLQSPISAFILLALISLLGLSPFLWAMIPDLRQAGDFFASGGGFADIFSADLMGYLVPTRLHPLFGQGTASLPFANNKAQHIYMGYSALLLSAIGLITLMRRPQREARLQGWFWLVNTAFFWLLTLGPRLRWAGHDLPIPGPFELISRLPFFNGNRYPSRYSVMLMLCMAVGVGYGTHWILERLKIRDRGQSSILHPQSPIANSLSILIFSILYLFEHLSIPLPLNDFRPPPIYTHIAAQSGDFALLELPTGWRNGARVLGKSDVLIMMQQWYQTAHGKRRLGGNTSRNPAEKFQYFTDAPLLGDLIALMNADRDHIAPVVADELEAMMARARGLAPQVLDLLGVQFVIVHVEKSPSALLRFVAEALPLTLVEEWQGRDWSGAPSTIRLYRVQAKPPAPVGEIDLTEPNGRLYLAEGWSALAAPPVRYATRPDPELLLDLPPAGGKAAIQLFGPASQVEVILNGTWLTTLEIERAEQGAWAEVHVPPGVAARLVDRLQLRFMGPALPPQALIPSPETRGWPIGRTGAYLAPGVALAAHSAGEEVGDFAHIYVNGEDIAPNQRGYNLAALTAEGQILDSAVFDTFKTAEESAALARWLQRWPAGVVIAGAAADEAGLHLSQEAVDGLRTLGVAANLAGKFRWSHAFVGVVGAPFGSAVEMHTLLQPAAVAVGAAVDGRLAYGGVGRIRFRAAPN